MRLRTGKNGSAFLGCTAYPKCRNAISVRVSGGKAEARPDEPTGEKCPVCGHDLVKRHGRFGEYVSCSNYPNCRYKPPKPVTLTGVTCPECHKGQIVERKGRFGPFYGCARYPECTKNFRARPVPAPCPKCGTAYLLVRERKGGSFYVCEAEGCDYDEPARDLERYPLTTEVTEEARQAALAAATMKVAAKKTPRRRPAPPPEPQPEKKATGKKTPAKKPEKKSKPSAKARPKGAPKKARK
jgi:DNA topoisomerase-1